MGWLLMDFVIIRHEMDCSPTCIDDLQLPQNVTKIIAGSGQDFYFDIVKKVFY
jgi:hypothetical protein